MDKDVREVWSWNLERELRDLRWLLYRFNFVSFDTEFPGNLRNTPRYASEEKRFSDMRYNVNRTKLIQLGITISDADWNVGGVWEFNFQDFDVKKDEQVEASISLLKKNGINFKRLRREGISIEHFSERFMEILQPHYDLKWVTFHGLYDVAYLTKLLAKTEIPESSAEFLEMALQVFGSICDVKFIARFCEGMNGGELGLERMAKLLEVKRIGTAHRAGSDSLLTHSVFEKISEKFEIPAEKYDGFLYGYSIQMVPSQPLYVDEDGFVYPVELNCSPEFSEYTQAF